MKIYISVDMEGASGVTQAKDLLGPGPSYERHRKFLTQDVNAAIKGAFEAGATEIIVNEAHSSMTNLLIEELNPDVEVIIGANKPFGMMQGLDETFAAVFCIGYHSRAGTQAAVANHTIGLNTLDFKMNGESVGEFEMNAYFAGFYNVPVVLVTGCDKICEHAKECCGKIETVQVKEGIDQFVAKVINPVKTKEMIREGAKEALSNLGDFSPVKIDSPITTELSYYLSAMATKASMIPGVNRIDGRTVSFTFDNYLDAFQMCCAATLLGSVGHIKF